MCVSIEIFQKRNHSNSILIYLFIYLSMYYGDSSNEIIILKLILYSLYLIRPYFNQNYSIVKMYIFFILFSVICTCVHCVNTLWLFFTLFLFYLYFLLYFYFISDIWVTNWSIDFDINERKIYLILHEYHYIFCLFSFLTFFFYIQSITIIFCSTYNTHAQTHIFTYNDKFNWRRKAWDHIVFNIYLIPSNRSFKNFIAK